MVTSQEIAFFGVRLGKGAVFLDLVLLRFDVEDSGVDDLECRVEDDLFDADDRDKLTAEFDGPTLVAGIDRVRIRAGWGARHGMERVAANQGSPEVLYAHRVAVFDVPSCRLSFEAKSTTNSSMLTGA